LQGRKKAVIFVAGLKFFPEEVEACINEFPGVKESRVFGTPHAQLGQVPRAEVVFATPSPDVDGLRRHCARVLSPYKVPAEFTVVEATGKILRRPDERSVAAERS
jgi:acyl-CoA synthetase (AMP-forming)/AMP-acid ligase II